ncbi:Kelch domain-containing protein 10 [Thelohanellus kitauei]|uniref:Kelch domain-containing protein 10 n=1 Tax=Thelohanellus kitauei TaxID=669202 RepID=A0A0C2MZ13_THEKT|nr:Kelch domain-containing protein 10 [Thelohanellus kitauei]
MYKFCLKTSTWSWVKQNGVKLSKRLIGGTIYKNQIYMFECVEPRTKRFRKILIFDFSTNTWTKRGIISKNHQYPTSELCGSCAFSKNIGYMSGGKHLGSSSYLSDIFKIDLDILLWFRVDYTLEVGIYDHCTSIVDDCYLFSFGGRRFDIDEDTTFQKIMIRPPTLYRLCLESVHRSQKEESLSQELPISILDDLNLNSNK